VSGAGGIVHLSDSHELKFKVGSGQGTNNFAKLMALKLSLILAAERGVSCLQVFSDSLLAINWLNEVDCLENFLLQPVRDEILAIKSSFVSLSFQHVYREGNRLADNLSKEGLQLASGRWLISGIKNGHTVETEHEPCF
jgi:ribonuclease HI